MRPGSTLGNRAETFLVRGLQSSSFAKDGFAINTDIFSNVGFLDLANVDRVEVLKGPASALYGINAPGGLINVVTKRPLSEPYYAGEFTAGTYEFYRPSLDLSGPLTPNKALLYRLNAAYQSEGSFRDFFIDGRRTFVSPILSWQIGPNTTLTGDFEYLDQKRQFDRGLVAIGDRVADIPFSRFFGEEFSTYEATQMRGRYLLEHTFNDVWSLRSTARIAGADDRRFSADPRGLEEDERTLVRRVTHQENDTAQYSWQNDVLVKFRTGFLGHKVLGGFELSRREFDNWFEIAPLDSIDIFRPAYGAKPGPFDPRVTNDAWLNLFALYLQDEVSFGEHVRLLLGGRYDAANSRWKFDGDTTPSTDQAFTPRVGLVFLPIPTVALYANYAESFLPLLGATFEGTPFEPETGEQYEVGVKAEFFQRRLAATLAFFYITRQNVPTDDPDNPGFAIQTGEQRSRGIELDVAGEILPGWRVIASGAFTDAKITKDNFFPVGTRLDGVPTLGGSLWTLYEVGSGDLKGFGAGAGLFAAVGREGDLDNTFRVPGYATLDATLYYRFRDRLKASLYIRNLLNKKYIESAGGREEIYPGAPITVLGELALRF